jgi:hypothetical protein
MGGAVEDLTGNYGLGFTGRRLVDYLLDPAWRAEDRHDPPCPQEAVISFFEREPALIGALTIVLPADVAAAPKVVEVWTSMASPDKEFTRVATATLQPSLVEQTVSFPPVEARFVKLRVLSGVMKEALEIAEVRVIEAAHAGIRRPRLSRV